MKLGNAFQAVSGRSGNAVYRTTKFGTEFAVRPFVNNPDTPSQNAIRSAFSKVTKQWKTLTTAQAAAWNTYAAERVETERISGAKTTRTGFNWFVGYGTRYLTVNPTATSAPATPPSQDFNGDAISITVASASGGVKFTANAANGSKTTTALLVQRLRNGNAKPGKQFRTKAHYKFVTGGLETTIALTPGYYAVGYQFVNTDTGQETDFVSLGIVGPISFAMSGTDSSAKKKAA